MDAREAVRLAKQMAASKRKKLKQVVKKDRHEDIVHSKNYKEDSIIDAIDNLAVLRKHAKSLEELVSGELTPEQFLNKHSPTLLCELFKIGMNPQASEKVKLDAVKDFLDRAGLSAIKKVAVASVDPSMSKQQLQSAIDGIAKHADIEIIEDEDVEDQD